MDNKEEIKEKTDIMELYDLHTKRKEQNIDLKHEVQLKKRSLSSLESKKETAEIGKESATQSLITVMNQIECGNPEYEEHINYYFGIDGTVSKTDKQKIKEQKRGR